MLVIFKYLYVRLPYGVYWAWICPSCGKHNDMPNYGPQAGKEQKCKKCHTLCVEGDMSQIDWS